MAKTTNRYLKDVSKSALTLRQDNEDDIIVKVEEILSSFEAHKVGMLKRLKSNQDADGTASLYYTAALQTVMEAIPLVETNLKKYGNERAVYAFNALVNLGRELNQDLRSLEDRRNLTSNLMDTVIDPEITRLYSQARNSITLEVDRIMKDLPKEVKPIFKKGIEKCLQNLTENIKEARTSIEVKASKLIDG
jgi:transposase